MSRIKNHIHDWLESYGYDLGYDMGNAPDLPDLWWVVEDRVDAEVYCKKSNVDGNYWNHF